jgi:K+-transporting ATPase A subunit
LLKLCVPASVNYAKNWRLYGLQADGNMEGKEVRIGAYGPLTFFKCER